MPTQLVLILLLLVVNGFFVAAEFALVRSRRTRLEAMVRGGDRLARLALRASSQLPRMISACQLGITLASLGIGWVAQGLVADLVEAVTPALPAGVEFSLRFAVGATAVLLAAAWLHVVFGELLPRAAAIARPEALARWLSGPLLLFATVATPLLALVTRSARALAAPLGVSSSAEEEAVRSPEELRLLVERSHEGGVLEAHDATLIEGVFEFSEKTAREVMTPRTEIVALPVEATLEETLAVVAEGGFSRYPVYEDTIDDIVGIVLAKDLLLALHRPAAEFRLADLLRHVHVVPGSRLIEAVLSDFKRLKEHMAIVVDEYGGTAGLLTMEDLLEEIVGDILDEYDEPEDAAPQPASGPAGGKLIIPGGTNIGELNERYSLSVPDEDHTTIGGFVFGQLGRLPRPGDTVTSGGAVFTVRSMEGRRIDSLAVDLAAAGDRRLQPRPE